MSDCVIAVSIHEGSFAALAEFEHNLVSERTRSGLDAARSRGKRGGRPKVISDENYRLFVKLSIAEQAKPLFAVHSMSKEQLSMMLFGKLKL